MQESGLSYLGYEFQAVCFEGKKLDLKKTLFANGIKQDSYVLFIIKFNPGHKINNIIKSFHQITLSGMDFNGKTKINQDTTLVKLNIGGILGFNLFGILDGHGQ